MEYWGLEEEAAMPPSPAAVAIKVGSSFLKRNWWAILLGGGSVVVILTAQTFDYLRRARKRKEEAMERVAREDLQQRASSGDAEAIELIQQMNESDAAAAEARRNAQHAKLEDWFHSQNETCCCM